MNHTDDPLVGRESTETTPLPPVDAAPLHAIAVGDVLAERFLVVRPLGRGGVGVVFEVRDLESGRPAALKALRVPRPERAHLIKSEFRAVQRVHSPHLVPLHELFVRGGDAFLTMDLVRGVPLTRAAGREREQSRWPAVRDLFRQCALGLRALHGAGLLHRDLKPANVLVDDSGHVSLLDFGLVDADGLSLPGSGTPAYMAPEQRAGVALGASADWFAFGALLFEVLSRGERPSRQGAHALPADVPEDLAALCRRLLAHDPAARPDGAEVVRALVADDDNDDGGLERAGEVFVGRAAALATLFRAFEETGAGRPGIALVKGPAGSGKSSLVRRALSLQHEPRALVLRAACNEYESVTFNAFDSLVDELVAHLARQPGDGLGKAFSARLASAARVFPALGNLLPPGAAVVDDRQLAREQRREAFRVLGELLARVARERPLVLWIDDVQWADDDSVDLLRELLAHLVLRPRDGASGVPLLLVACARDSTDELPFLGTLCAAAPAWRVCEIPLAELTADECAELAGALLGKGASMAQCAQVAAESLGNPLFLEALARLPPEQAAGVSLGGAIHHLVRQLHDDERLALEHLSAWSGPMPREVAHRAAAAAGGRHVYKRLCELRLARWTAHLDTLEVGHARIREEVYSSLATNDRQARHAALVEVALGWPEATHGLLANQMVRAGDARALAHVRAAAADATAALAFRRAERWLRLALTLPDAGAPEVKRELHAALARALSAAGHGQAAADEYLRAAEGADLSESHEHRRAAASELFGAGRIDEGRALLHDVLREVGVRPPRFTAGAAARLLVARLRLRLPSHKRASSPDAALLRRADALGAGANGYISTDTLRGAWFAAHQLLVAERAGEPTRIVRATVLEALYLANEGRGNEARVNAALARARALTDQNDDDTARALLALSDGVAALLVGRFAAAELALRRAERRLAAPGMALWFELGLCRRFRLVASWFTGSVAALDEPMRAWIEDARERGDELSRREFAADLPLHSLFRDDVTMARAELAAVEAELRPATFDEAKVVWLHNRMLTALYTDEPPAVMRSLDRRMRPFWRSLLATGQLIRATSQYYVGQCLLASALHGEARLLARVTRAARSLRKERVPYALHYATLLEAGVAHQLGDDVTSLSLLERAASGLDDDGQRASAAATHWRIGEILGGEEGGGRIDAARAALRGLDIASPARMVQLLAPGFRPRAGM